MLPHTVPFDQFGCDKYGYFKVPLEIPPDLEFPDTSRPLTAHESLLFETGARMWILDSPVRITLRRHSLSFTGLGSAQFVLRSCSFSPSTQQRVERLLFCPQPHLTLPPAPNSPLFSLGLFLETASHTSQPGLKFCFC